MKEEKRMQYNFSKLTNRFNTNSLKWDVNNNELPMWVADMAVSYTHLDVYKRQV